MTKHAQLAVDLISKAPNGVLGLVATNEAIDDFSLLDSSLFVKFKKHGLAKLALSRGHTSSLVSGY